MIKKVNKTELKEIMEIWLKSNIQAHNFIPEEYWNNKYADVKNMLPSSELYCEQTDAIEGFIGIVEKHYIAGLFVLKKYQGRGIGTNLLTFCKNRYKHLVLDVYAKNEHAIRFYEKHGFVIIAEKTDEDTFEKEYQMEWRSK